MCPGVMAGVYSLVSGNMMPFPQATVMYDS